MNDMMRTILVTRHGDIRSGWRILLFFLLLSLFGVLVIGPIIYFDVPRRELGALGVILAVLSASYVMTRYVNRKPFEAIGLWLHARSIRDTGAGVGIGILMMTGIFVVEVALGYATPVWQGFAAGEAGLAIFRFAVTFTLAAALEELLFRGYPFQTLIQAITLVPAMLLVSILFALAHAQNPNVTPFGLFNVGLAGVWLSFAYYKTRGLWLPTGLHFGWNFAQTALFGFPTSGADFEGLKPVVTVQAGPEWITGGAFGPEGGALATISLVAGTWYLLKSRAISTPPGIVTLESLEDLLRPTAEDKGAA